MPEIIALATKDLRLLLRDKAGFFFAFIFPLLMAVFFGTIFSGGDDGNNAISLLVVDEDTTEQSLKFTETLAESEELDVEITTKDDAVQRVRRGRSVAYVLLKRGFGEARERTFWGGAPTVQLGVDPARRAEAGLIQGVLTKYAAEDMQEMFTNPTSMREQVNRALDSLRTSNDFPFAGRENLIRFLEELNRFVADSTQMASGGGDFQGFRPLKIEQADIIRERRGPQNAYEITFPQGIIWGMIGCTAAFGISLVVERTRGTLVRLRIAPISEMQILAGKALACFVTTVAVSITLLSIATIIFGVRPKSIVNLGLAVVAVSIGFVGIMMFLAVLGKTEQSAGGIGWAVLLVMSMLGGGMIPLFGMPTWMQKVSHISPVRWSILAIEGALWRSFTLVEMLLPCGILLALGIVFFTVGLRAFSWAQKG